MRNLFQKFPSRNSGSRFDGHIALLSRKTCTKGREAELSPRFPSCNQPALYRPSPSGKASLCDSFTVSQLTLFPFSSSTATAAAVNTPAIPASMPPINAHLPFMNILLFSYINAGGGSDLAPMCLLMVSRPSFL